MSLTRRQTKKRQMLRTGYAGIGVGVLILLYALTAGAIVLAVIGVVILVIAGWATRALRTL
jgi:sorbitol-specific phosphotransferase system component IIC